MEGVQESEVQEVEMPLVERLVVVELERFGCGRELICIGVFA